MHQIGFIQSWVGQGRLTNEIDMTSTSSQNRLSCNALSATYAVMPINESDIFSPSVGLLSMDVCRMNLRSIDFLLQAFVLMIYSPKNLLWKFSENREN